METIVCLTGMNDQLLQFKHQEIIERKITRKLNNPSALNRELGNCSFSTC